MKTAFVPGLELARRYYAEVVRLILDRRFGGLEHSAALIGWGSDVLGYDSARSTDHNWGPRCLVFLGAGDAGRTEEIRAVLAAELPETFLGWPTRFSDVGAPGWPVRHWVEVAEVGSWLDAQLGFDPRLGVGLADWLATPTQVLAEITGGAVFHDGLGDRREPGGLGPSRRRWPGIPMTSGATFSPASGPGSTRRRRFPGGALRPGMSSARLLWRPGWSGT